MIAIVIKEWRRFLRSPALPWVLLVYVLLPVLISVGYLRIISAGQGMQPGMIPLIGAHSLSVIATWQILMLAVLAAWLAGGLLAAEVEEGTLGPLLVAGQRVIGIVLAKFVAVVLLLVILVAVGLPLYVLPFMVGGVSWLLLAKALLIELATVVAMAGAGLVISAGSRRAAGAAMTGMALALLLTLGGALAAQLNPVSTRGPGKEIFMARPMDMGMAYQGQQKVSPWLYPNPVVGLNNAINQSALPGLFGFPGGDLKPVYKNYPLWKVQLAGAGGVGVASVLAAWAAVAVRLRWRWPLWRLKRKAREVPVNG